MQDFHFARSALAIGQTYPDSVARACLRDNHKRRLEALDRVVQEAKKCGVDASADGDLLVFGEEEITALFSLPNSWPRFAEALSELRKLLPIVSLSKYGFSSGSETLDEEGNPFLRKRIGVGVEAWAFLGNDSTIYKFFRPIGNGRIGASFDFRFEPESEPRIIATHCEGTYRDLFAKFRLIAALDGMDTDVVGITLEGIVVTVQVYGDILPQGEDVSNKLPRKLIPIPSTFLRANRDHPRLYFIDEQPWLVADLHARNLACDTNGEFRVIDLIGAPWPMEMSTREPLIMKWLKGVQRNPRASILGNPSDDEL